MRSQCHVQRLGAFSWRLVALGGVRTTSVLFAGALCAPGGVVAACGRGVGGVWRMVVVGDRDLAGIATGQGSRPCTISYIRTVELIHTISSFTIRGDFGSNPFLVVAPDFLR